MAGKRKKNKDGLALTTFIPIQSLRKNYSIVLLAIIAVIAFAIYESFRTNFFDNVNVACKSLSIWFVLFVCIAIFDISMNTVDVFKNNDRAFQGFAGFLFFILANAVGYLVHVWELGSLYFEKGSSDALAFIRTMNIILAVCYSAVVITVINKNISPRKPQNNKPVGTSLQKDRSPV